MKFLISVCSFCILASIVALDTLPASANGVASLRADVMKIADREMDKLGFKRSEWKAHLDDDNTEWKEVAALRRNSPISEAREYFENQEAKLRGHRYRAIHYEHVAPPGVTEKDGEVWVFVAQDSGEVLLVIPPGH